MHLDGYNLLPHLTGKEAKSPRQGFIYFTDDGDVAALRYDNWKMVFLEQRVPGTLQDLAGAVRAAARAEDLQSADGSVRARADHLEHLLRLDVPTHLSARSGAGHVGEFLATFKEFPPRQKAASFSLDQVIEKMTEASGGGGH